MHHTYYLSSIQLAYIFHQLLYEVQFDISENKNNKKTIKRHTQNYKIKLFINFNKFFHAQRKEQVFERKREERIHNTRQRTHQRKRCPIVVTFALRIYSHGIMFSTFLF